MYGKEHNEVITLKSRGQQPFEHSVLVCKIYTRVELTNDACCGNIHLLYIIGVCAFHTATSPAAARIP